MPPVRAARFTTSPPRQATRNPKNAALRNRADIVVMQTDGGEQVHLGKQEYPYGPPAGLAQDVVAF